VESVEDAILLRLAKVGVAEEAERFDRRDESEPDWTI